MNGSISNADAGNSSADTLVVHYEIKSEVFDEESAVIGQRTTEESVQHGVACSVSHCASTVCLF